MSNLIKRTVPVIFVLAICISCLVFPAAASSVDDSYYINLLDYLEEPYFNVSLSRGEVDEFELSLPFYVTDGYVDFIFYFNRTITCCEVYRSELTVVSLGNDIYRAFGSFDTSARKVMPLYFEWEGNSSARFTPIDLGLFTGSYISDIPAQVAYYNSGRQSYIQSSDSFVGSAIQGDFNGTSPFYFSPGKYYDDYYIHEFDLTTWVSPNDWKKADKLYFNYYFYTDTISSVTAKIDDFVLPVEVSYIDTVLVHHGIDHSSSGLPDSTTGPALKRLHCSIDLSNVDRSSSKFLGLQISGSYTAGISFHGSDFGSLQSITGIVVPEDTSIFTVWFRRIIDELRILNGSDAGGVSAQQKQEDINVSINNQLVAAVEDWNTNIEVVQAGYDTALTNVTPSLMWLSSLADGIFNGMGWFGSIYFLVGLISVIMLVLSKSGLAHKIGNISRRGD